MDQSNKEKQLLSRRDALKALAAAGGAAVLSTLPHKWEKPAVKVGTLPAFAQVSPTALTISNLTSDFVGAGDCLGGLGNTQIITFDYSDPAGAVTTGAVVHDDWQFSPSGLSGSDDYTIPDPFVVVDGDGTNGTITLLCCTRFGDDTTVIDRISITNAIGQTSNQLTVTTPAPPGAVGTGVSSRAR